MSGTPAGGRIEPFFRALLERDAAGGSWLPDLLRAAPRGREALGDLVDAPGWLVSTLAIPAASGRLGGFEFPVMPSRELERWWIDHPQELVWPAEVRLSPEVERLRRALLRDDPPGSRERAQDRARELLRTRSALAREWWRFEDVALLDCALITDRLVVTVQEAEGDMLAPVTAWYPRRSRLVRDLDAARQIADGRAFGTLLLSERPVAAARDDALAAALADGAPHLDEAGRDELRRGFLGNLTWSQAAAAVGIPSPR